MLGVVLPAFGAFVLAAVAVLIVALVAAAASRWPGKAFNFQLLLVTVASAGTIMLSSSAVRVGDAAMAAEVTAESDGGIFAKMLLIAAVGVAVSLCAAWVFRFRKAWSAPCRFQSRGLLPPTDIAVAFLVYYVSFSILPILFGQSFFFHVSLIYPFFVFLALFLWVQVSTVDPVVVFKRSLGLLALGSLAAAIFFPQYVMDLHYVGLVPGVNFRLWGITATPNTLGSVACVLLVLEVAVPSERLWVRNSLVLGCVITLLMSQSKTSIAATFVGVAIIISWRLIAKMRQFSVSSDSNEKLIATVVLALASGSFALVGFWLMFVDLSVFSGLENKLNAQAVGDLRTATGRTWIWSVAVQAGLENPLFGQGAGFWSFENRQKWGLSGAVHAHNLYLQAFSRAGLVGLLSLLVFLYFLVRYSVRAAKPTNGGSIALLVVFMIRSISEVPIEPNAILGGEFFAVMAFIFYVVDRGARPLEAAMQTSAQAPEVLKA